MSCTTSNEFINHLLLHIDALKWFDHLHEVGDGMQIWPQETLSFMLASTKFTDNHNFFARANQNYNAAGIESQS